MFAPLRPSAKNPTQKLLKALTAKNIRTTGTLGQTSNQKNPMAIVGKFLLHIGIIFVIFSILTTKKTVKYLYLLWGQSIRISQMKLLKSYKHR